MFFLILYAILKIGGGKIPRSSILPLLLGILFIMMEVQLVYQDRQIALSRPETKYGSNIESFSELVKLAFEGVGLELVGEVVEKNNENI